MTEFSWVDGPDAPVVEITCPRRGSTSLKRAIVSASDSPPFDPAAWLRMQYLLGHAPPPDFEVRVVGAPAPQGSKVPGRRAGDGHIPLRENSKRVKPWREDIDRVVLDIVSPDKGVTLNPGFPLTGPLVGEIVFTMKKPGAAPKRRKTYPATKGNDVSKLLRSTEDALVKVGALEDDGLIVEYLRLAKVFPGEDVDALAVPGALIRFWAVNRLPELGS